MNGWGFKHFAGALVVFTFGLVCEVQAAIQLGYSNQTYHAEQGLPQHNINSIIQSREGYLWLGAYGGLVRFDGVRFKVFDAANTPELQNSRITALFEDAAGTIWIGHETGDLTRLRGGKFEAVTVPGAVRREAVVGITTDAEGTPLLFYQSAALRNIETGALLHEGSFAGQGGVTTCVRDGSGALWILNADVLTRVADGRAERVDRYSADQMVNGIGAARDGGIWIAKTTSIQKRFGEKWGEELPAPWRALETTQVTALLEMRDGTLAIATANQGIYILGKNSIPLHLDRTDGLPPDWIRALCEDREGNLWIGLGSGGLIALRPDRLADVQPSDRADRWKGRPLSNVLAASDGSVFIGTEGAGLYRYRNGVCMPFLAPGAPPTNSTITSLAEDAAGQLWVSAAEKGLFVYNGERFAAPPGLAEFTTPVRALFRSPTQGAMLLGVRSGLLKYDGQNLHSLTTNLIGPDVRCIAEQTDGVLWFGMFGGGLGRLENGVVKQFRKSQGLASDFIQALHLERDNTLWIGAAESGLTRFKDGKFASVTTQNGLRDNVICHIAEDGQGYFWISSFAGIMRVAKSELNQCADGAIKTVQCFSFSESDGLPSALCAGGFQPVGARTADGVLWFPTLKGIGLVDPLIVRTNQLPGIVIEQLRVNDEAVPVSNGRTASIPPGRQRFELDFTAFSFAAPERILFKYRLDGVEEEWVGPTSKRTVSYNHLAPGDYTFRVVAANSDGAWNDSPATLSFTILPFFWQTVWFRALVVVLSLGMAGMIVLVLTRARYRRRLELAERQRSIERERARIAQDIHDDLGSSLTRIILLSQSARGDLDSPELAAGDLDRIYDTARNLTRSLDEIVWAVNPRHDTLDSLATYLGKFAQDFLGAANIRCRLDLPVSLPSWPLNAETRHNVFLAFKEALNNAVKYAEATEVKISLSLEAAAFTLIVEDNGRGFDPSAVPSDATDTEDGLANMRKRLSDVGGSCQIHSRIAEGTRIRFNVPVSANVASA